MRAATTVGQMAGWVHWMALSRAGETVGGLVDSLASDRADDLAVKLGVW